MTNTTKMTKKAAYTSIREFLADNGADSTLVDFINHELELLDKRSSKGSGKPSAQKKANEGLKASILAEMVESQPYCVTDMMHTFDCLSGLESPQRVTALVTQLKNEGQLTRIVVKRKAYFIKGEVLEEVAGE